MRLLTFQTLIQTVVEAHRARVRFFTGMEKDFDPANQNLFPAVICYPVALNQTLQPPQLIRTYVIELACLDLLPPARTTADVNRILHKTQQVLEAILLRYNLVYGFPETDVTVGGVTERADFTIGPVAWEPVLDDTSNNLTGWKASFQFKEETQFSACCVDDQFAV